MGLSETRRWVLLVLTQELTGGSSDELVRTALIRAVLCERIAEKAGLNISQMESFMVGMFSILDRNDPDFESLLNELELTDRIKNGLMDQQSLMGRILKVVQYYEQGDWKQVDAMVGLYGWDLGELYRFAVEYADEALEIDDGAASA